jgi:hypothetical protein
MSAKTWINPLLGKLYDEGTELELLSGINFINFTVTRNEALKTWDIESLGGGGGGTQDIESVLDEGNDAGGQQIKNLQDPTDPQDAATRAYVLANAGGGTLPQILGAGNTTGGNNIVLTSGDVLTSSTNANVVLSPNGSGVVQIAKDLDANGKYIVNLLDPVNAQDAATRAYVLAGIAGLSSVYVPLARTVSAGTGLTGGGALSSNLTLTVSFGTSSTTVCVGNDARLSDDRVASGLRNARTSVSISTGESPLPGDVFTALSSVGAGWSHPDVSYITSVPTLGFWRTNAILIWGADASRLYLRPRRRGVLGETARANSTSYTIGQIFTSSSKAFVVCIAGTTAGSAPAGLATAALGDRITDGTAVVECVATTVQTPDFCAVPNLSAVPVTSVIDGTSNVSVSVDQGPVFECGAASANRTITMLTTNAVQGDVITFRVFSVNAFTWQFTHASGDTVNIPASSYAVVRFRYNGTGWKLYDNTGTVS